MKTAREIAYMREIAAERAMAEQCAQVYATHSYIDFFFDHVYRPVIIRLIADLREKGLLPKEPL